MPRSDDAEKPDFVDGVVQHYVEKFAWADPEAIELNYRLSAAYVAVRASGQRFFTSHGHERASGKVGVLRALYFAPGMRMSQNEISNNMNVASASVTYIVDALEKDSLVVRKRHPTDRRVTWVELTPEGQTLFDSLAGGLTEFLMGLAKDFSTEEKRLLRDLLIRYKRNAESMYTGEGANEGAVQS